MCRVASYIDYISYMCSFKPAVDNGYIWAKNKNCRKHGYGETADIAVERQVYVHNTDIECLSPKKFP